MLQTFEKKIQNKLQNVEKNKNQRANTVDPDETAHYELSHLDLQCLQKLLLYLLCFTDWNTVYIQTLHRHGEVLQKLQRKWQRLLIRQLL